MCALTLFVRHITRFGQINMEEMVPIHFGDILVTAKLSTPLESTALLCWSDVFGALDIFWNLLPRG